MNSAIRFMLDGETVQVSSLPATTTVLEYLREQAGRCGTKEGCAEGDCGACTVVLGEIDETSGAQRIRYRAINSCIRFLPTLDGKELITVESLRDGEALHPVQQAMVDVHASQCGFCTPGFVMSLLALYLNTDAVPERDEVVATLAGNLCRCTGYRPIIEAGCGMQALPTPARWSREDAQSPIRLQALLALQRTQGLAMPGYCAPRTLDELQAALQQRPQALLLAGGTDVGLWVTKQLRDLPDIIYLGDVVELKRVERGPAGLRIGAAVALTDAWQALVELHAPLAELAQRFASPPVRNSATLCGNLANGSPIGDSMPALIALRAVLELRSAAATRHVPLEDFYLGYQHKDLAAGEFVAAVLVPSPVKGQRFASYKLSKRNEQDISAVCVGIAVDIDDEGLIVDARIAFGGMAATPKRAPAAEAALRGEPWSEASFDAAIAALSVDYAPLSDMRASSAYRLRSAGNLLRRFFIEHNTVEPKALRLEHTIAELSA